MGCIKMKFGTFGKFGKVGEKIGKKFPNMLNVTFGTGYKMTARKPKMRKR